MIKTLAGIIFIKVRLNFDLENSKYAYINVSKIISMFKGEDIMDVDYTIIKTDAGTYVCSESIDDILNELSSVNLNRIINNN